MIDKMIFSPSCESCPLHSRFGVVWRRVCLRSPCMPLEFSSTEFPAALAWNALSRIALKEILKTISIARKRLQEDVAQGAA